MSHATIIDEPICFACEGEQLVGMVHAPDSPCASDVGVVLIVGGPQYRVGSHRLFVRLCRELAVSGTPSLRFDVRGMGDSTGESRSFEALSADVAAAIDALITRRPEIRRVILWGLCDGASAALLYCHETRDPRVTGLCLVNPWVRNGTSLAKTHVKHYYFDRIRQPEFWAKLSRGKISRLALQELWENISKAVRRRSSDDDSDAPFPARMAKGLTDFEGRVQLVISGRDYTAREFIEHGRSDVHWRAALARSTITQTVLDEADHTISSEVDASRLTRITRDLIACCQT